MDGYVSALVQRRSGTRNKYNITRARIPRFAGAEDHIFEEWHAVLVSDAQSDGRYSIPKSPRSFIELVFAKDYDGACFEVDRSDVVVVRILESE